MVAGFRGVVNEFVGKGARDKSACPLPHTPSPNPISRGDPLGHDMIENKLDNPDNVKDSAKITFILDVIKRYDNYIVSTNAKASLIIAFNSLIIGTVLLKFDDIISFVCSPSFYCFQVVMTVVCILLVLITASSLLSLFYVFSVVYPYFGSKSDCKKQQDSLIYFGSVSGMNGLGYFERFDRVTIKELIADLAEQAIILAGGLKKKMLKMRRSIETITFSLLLILILVLVKAANFIW